MHLSEEHYDLIILQIGANDIVGRTDYKKIRSLLRSVLDRASLLSEKVVVLTSGDIGLSPVFRFPVSVFMTHRTRMVRDIFMEEINDRVGVYYVDLLKDKEEDPFSKNVDRYYAPDFFHPSGEGYQIWYEQMKPVLLE